jgi:hypothetical protein
MLSHDDDYDDDGTGHELLHYNAFARLVLATAAENFRNVHVTRDNISLVLGIALALAV